MVLLYNTYVCSCIFSLRFCFDFSSLASPPPPPTHTHTIKNTTKNNQAIKGLSVDHNLRAQRLPPPVCECKYALLHNLYRNCTWLSYLARLVDICLNEKLKLYFGRIWRYTYCYLEVLKHMHPKIHAPTIIHGHTHSLSFQPSPLLSPPPPPHTHTHTTHTHTHPCQI